MASALLEALAIPAAEMNMLRLQFSQLNIQLQQRMKKSVEPPGCQTKISCMVTYSYSTWGLFVQNQQLKEDPCRITKVFLSVQHRKIVMDVVSPFTQVIVTVLKLF